MRRIPWPWALLALAGGAWAQVAAPATPAAAEPPVAALTLQQAIATALERHPEMAAARHAREAAAAARAQADVRANPTLDMEVEDTRRATRTTTVRLTQPIDLGGQRAARVDAAERAEAIAQAQITARRIELRSAVTAAYFEALIADECVRQAQASLDLARRGTEAVGKRVEAGKIAPIDDTKARVAETGVRLELQQAATQREISLARLQAEMGQPEVAITRLDGRVDALPPEMSSDALASRMEGAPALREARLEVDRQRALARLERARRVPDLAVSLGAMRAEDEGRTKAVIGVSIPLPFFDRNEGALREALRRTDQADATAAALALKLRADVYDAHARQRALRTQITSLQRDVLPGAEAAYEAARTGFELGKFPYLDVLDAQRTLFQARAQYLQSLADAHRATADLERLLDEPNSTTAFARQSP